MHWLIHALIVVAEIGVLVISATSAISAVLIICLVLRIFLRPILHRQQFLWLKELSRLQASKTVEGEDVVGFRYAYLSSGGQKVYFRSIVQSVLFGIAERAKCLSGADHKVPDPGCMCGFYALRKAERLAWKVPGRLGAKVLLQVQLSGTVVEGKNGFRGARQDVLKVWLPSRCYAWRCRGETHGVLALEGDNDQILAPCCTRHFGGTVRLSQPTFTLTELRGKLQTEVGLIGQ